MEDIDKRLDGLNHIPAVEYELVQEHLGDVNEVDDALEETAVPEQYLNPNISSSTCLNDEMNRNFLYQCQGMRNKQGIIRDSILEESLHIPGRTLPNWSIMYVDDLSIGEVNDIKTASITISERKENRRIHSRFCEETFATIEENSTRKGMKINAAKTQLLCMSGTNFAETESYIKDTNGNVINSSDEMKILGFIFSKEPNVNAHMDYTATKFNRAVWALSHLRRAKIDNTTLLRVYLVMLRPIIEFCSPVYHTMLTKEQSLRIEGLQRRALQIIYGFGECYSDLLDRAGIESLEERRKRACSNFARNMANSERFGHWFQERERNGPGLRCRRRYEEDFARTSRLYNSPLFYMRRLLNAENETEEDITGLHNTILQDLYSG